MIADRVREARPHFNGRHTGNHCLRAMRTFWERSRRRGWIAKDPFLDVAELPTKAAEVFLEDADLAAIGEATRYLEALAVQGSADSRQSPSLGALLAVRVVLYTGLRHREEMLKGKLSWLCTDYGIPRLEVPRAKGRPAETSGGTFSQHRSGALPVYSRTKPSTVKTANTALSWRGASSLTAGLSGHPPY